MSNEDNFYVTLVSNVNHKVYDNKTSHFITELAEPLNLRGTWEVGLSHCLIPNSFYNIDGKINVLKFYEYRLIPNKRKEREKILVHISRLQPGFYESGEQVIKEIKKQWFNEWDDSVLHITENSKKMRFSLKEYQALELEPDLASILGFKYNIFDSHSKNPGKQKRDRSYVHQGSYPIDLNLHNNYIFIYTDIIQYSNLGDTSAPVLNVFGLLNTKKNNIMSRHFENPDYVRVAKNYINEILISVRGSNGKLIAFKSGSVILKLHFRKYRPFVL